MDEIVDLERIAALIRAVDPDLVAELRERTEGVGPDHYVDCSGVTASVDLGFDAIAPGGRITLYGVYRERATVDWNTVAEFKELEIRGGHLAPTEFGLALELLASRTIDGRRLVTASYPLDEAEVRNHFTGRVVGQPEAADVLTRLILDAFLDPGTLDTHTVQIDWGDGSAIVPADSVTGQPRAGRCPRTSWSAASRSWG